MYLVCRPSSTLFPYTTLFRSQIQPKKGSATRPIKARYARAYLEARGYFDPQTGNLTIPVFGLYAGRENQVTINLGFTIGFRKNTRLDRKSTRLNSSHRCISYAVPALHSFPTRRSSDLRFNPKRGRRRDRSRPAMRELIWKRGVISIHKLATSPSRFSVSTPAAKTKSQLTWVSPLDFGKTQD